MVKTDSRRIAEGDPKTHSRVSHQTDTSMLHIEALLKTIKKSITRILKKLDYL